MINKNLEEFLVDFANQEMKGDPFAWVIATHFKKINFTDKEKFYESTLNYYIQYRESKDLPIIERVSKDGTAYKSEHYDYRIKSIRIGNVRGIKDADTDGLLYGFELFENKIINSAVILGPNAEGKSSIFSAMEYIYAGEIGEKKLRCMDATDDEDYQDYLQRFNNGFTSAKCIVDTPSGELSLANKPFDFNGREKINPDSHFISDHDIYENGQLNYSGLPNDNTSFHFLIARSLGFQEFLDFNNLLKTFSNYRRQKEKKQLTALLTEQNQLETDLKNWTYEIESRKKRLEELSAVQAQIPKQDSRYQEIIASLLLFNNEVKVFESKSAELKVEIESFIVDHTELMAKRIDELINVEFDFLLLGKQLVKKREPQQCPLCESSTKSIQDIMSSLDSRLQVLTANNMLRKSLNHNYATLLNTIYIIKKQSEKHKEIISAMRDKISTYPETLELTALLLGSVKKITELLSADIFYMFENFTRENPTIEELSKLFNTLLQKKEDILTNSEQLETYIIDTENTIKAKIEEVKIRISELQSNKFKVDEIPILRSEIEKFILQMNNANKRNSNVIEEKKKIESVINLFEEMQAKATSMSNVLFPIINKSVIEALEPIEDVFREILTEYLKTAESVELIIHREQILLTKDDAEPTDVITARINVTDQDSGEIIILEPNNYFNTFRYKLFCLLVSISIAVASRKKTGINLPLVLDDVFYASDYISKSTFATFLISLISLFSKHTPELPFQFILFTHDDMIFQASLDAINQFNSNQLEYSQQDVDKVQLFPRSHTIFGRLFKAEDKDKEPSITDKKEKYWNMLYKLPAEIKIFVDRKEGEFAK